MVNAGETHNWKDDTNASVDMYNSWFMNYAPITFRDSRIKATKAVEKVFQATEFLKNITAADLQANPSILPVLRQSTCPPLAVDRLIGLSNVPSGVVDRIEKDGVLSKATTIFHLNNIIDVIDRLLDRDIFPWLNTTAIPDPVDSHRAATIIADRYCGSLANPLIRNAQEIRQLATIERWLVSHGYRKITQYKGLTFDKMSPGTFSFRMGVTGLTSDGKSKSTPIDAIIQPHTARSGDLPILVEAKSAGDFANTNKRWKEEATKFVNLKNAYGPDVRFVLFLCGYFDGKYLGANASEKIDWVWEHRIDDFTKMGL